MESLKAYRTIKQIQERTGNSMKAYTIKEDIKALKHNNTMNTALKVYQELTNNGFSVSFNGILAILEGVGTKADGDKADIIETLKECNTETALRLASTI